MSCCIRMRRQGGLGKKSNKDMKTSGKDGYVILVFKYVLYVYYLDFCDGFMGACSYASLFSGGLTLEPHSKILKSTNAQVSHIKWCNICI